MFRQRFWIVSLTLIVVLACVLKAGADVTLKNKEGKTALMMAKAGKRADSVRLLKKAGAKR